MKGWEGLRGGEGVKTGEEQHTVCIITMTHWYLYCMMMWQCGWCI